MKLNEMILWRGGLPVVSNTSGGGTQYGAEEDDEEWEEDTDGESTEDVDQHVRVAALPEDGTEHLCTVIPTGERRHKLGTHMQFSYHIILGT